MPSDPKLQLLKEAPKAIAHLRSQFDRKRLGLIFGSGIGKDLGFPDWSELVDRMANRPEIDGGETMARFLKQGTTKNPRSLASVTQMLFSQFRLKKIKEENWTTPLTFVQEQRINTIWMKSLHNELYHGHDLKSRQRKILKHPYLGSFRNIIRETHLTVNYNFDDSIEQMLMMTRSDEERNTTRGYEVSDHPSLQFQKGEGVIYHPNGYLPSIFNDGASSKVVLSDDAFQDQMISAATGKFFHLTNHLFSNTCLLVGLSLEDATLQSLLRQNAVTNPGNIHYFVHFTPKGVSRDLIQEEAIFLTNFESFNLYTLFLDQSGISALSRLINMEALSFKVFCKRIKPKFVYYIVGSVGSGKSTAAGNFRNLLTYDEWIDPRKPGLAKPDNELTPTERAQVDRWVAAQFRKKNIALSEKFDGIHLVDRSPLDPLTFGEPKVRPRKAQRLLKEITNDGSTRIEPGHVIYLDSCIEDISVRNTLKHKYWSEDEYKDLIENIEEIYTRFPRSVVCTRGRNAGEVAREIAKVIFLEEYNPTDIHAQLEFAAHPTHA